MCNAYSPDSSEKNAMDLPSGDQAGSRSATVVLCVKLRTSPFSPGTVRISPRRRQIARDLNVHFGRLAARRVKDVDSAKLFVDKRVRPSGKRFEVQPLVFDQLFYGLTLGVVRE